MYYWDQITAAMDAVAREHGPEAAAELAERLLMRYDDTRIVRILGDYDGERVEGKSIKGMLALILDRLNALYDIKSRLDDQYLEMTAINSSTAMMAKYGALRSTVNEVYARSRYGELRQSYRFRRVRQVQPPRYDPSYYPANHRLYEFAAPVARIPSEHNAVVDQGIHGCHVRIAQNHQIGLSPYVYTSLVFTWYLPGDERFAPVIWYGSSDIHKMYLALSSQPYIPVYASDPQPERVELYTSTTGGYGYWIYRQQLHFDAHGHLWLNVCMLVEEDDDPQVPWFASGEVQCQVDVYTGYINSLD